MGFSNNSWNLKLTPFKVKSFLGSWARDPKSRTEELHIPSSPLAITPLPAWSNYRLDPYSLPFFSSQSIPASKSWEESRTSPLPRPTGHRGPFHACWVPWPQVVAPLTEEEDGGWLRKWNRVRCGHSLLKSPENSEPTRPAGGC